MQIHELTQASTVNANDVFAIDTGSVTYKVPASVLIDALKSIGSLPTGVKGSAESTYRTGNVNLTPANIGAAAGIMIPSTATWADMYALLNIIPIGYTATFYCEGGGSATTTMSGGLFSGSLKGTVTNLGSGVFDVMASVGSATGFGIWRIEGLTGASATPSITYSQVYYSGRVPVLTGTVSVSDLATQSFQTESITFTAQPDTNYMLVTESSVAGFVTSVRDKTTTGCTLVIGNMRSTAVSGVVTWALVRK